MKRILIIKLWALGDIVMATPMLASLRARYPDIHITWVIDINHADLLTNHPGINKLVVLDTGKWRRLLRQGRIFAWLAHSYALYQEMARHDFGAVINCHPEKWWSMLLCAAPIRVGLYPSDSLPVLRRFYTKAVRRPRKPAIHNTDHYLLATQALGCSSSDKAMTLGETPDESLFLASLRETGGFIGDRPLVILAPFSTGENRVWESDRLIGLADWLNDTYQAEIIMPVRKADMEGAFKIIVLAKRQNITLIPDTTLRQYIALIRAADLVISGDSSPMHIAAALHTPFIALFGPTPISERAPLAGKGLALAKPLHCAPCDQSYCGNAVFRECMKLITIADVQAAVTTMLPLRSAQGNL